MKALIIIDMLKDFVDGALANEKAQEIVPNIKKLLDYARENRDDWVIVFSNDAHEPGDPELAVWGEHAMKGSSGAQVIEALEPYTLSVKELHAPKRNYGAFDQGEVEGPKLDEWLAQFGVDEVVLTGQHTHICVRHTSYGAFLRGLKITIPQDAVCAFAGVDEMAAFEYLHDVYGAKLTSVDELIEAPVAV